MTVVLSSLRRAAPAVVATGLVVALGTGTCDAAPDDPRIPIVERLLAGQTEAALEVADAVQVASPKQAEALGLSYLRGRLLQRLGRRVAAEDAFADALNEAPALQPYVKYQLARIQELNGHPEVATGLVASVVAPGTPRDLLEQATELFARSIAAGGDCRVLRGVRKRGGLPEEQDRLLRVVAGQCAMREGQPEEAAVALCKLVQEDREDDAARRAADLLDELLHRDLDLRKAAAAEGCDLELEVGLALHHHREYDRSIPYLERALARFPKRRIVADDNEFEARYALARGYFWREELAVAAEHFADLALRARDLEERSRVLYQQGRCLELMGRWTAADAVFRRTYMTLQGGRLSAPALLSAMRLEWRNEHQHERDALDLYRLLVNRRDGAGYAARGALFLASSDIVRGRSDRAGHWLDDAERFDRDARLEVTYWRGRLAELQNDPARAAGHYLDLAVEDPYHPLALEAVFRLRSEPLEGPALAEATRRARSGRPDDLFAVWLVAGDDQPVGRSARSRLESRLRGSQSAGTFLDLDPVPVAQWPLWKDPPDEAPGMLLALGLIDEGASAVREHFPADRPELAFTGSRLLLGAHRTRQAILLADVSTKPLTRRLEDPLLPEEIRALLYPFPWQDEIRSQAGRFDVDPYLLAAVIREESQFAPDAVSAVTARGLTQFVWLTAKRLAAQLGMGRISPQDLYRPEVSIVLGAVYLGELSEQFGGLEHEEVAAYNAGPAQARLWQAYCFTREMAEFYTKTGFSQTRGYLRRVLGSRAQYAELYGDEQERATGFRWRHRRGAQGRTGGADGGGR